MLKLTDIRKEYITGALRQEALKGVSVSLRDNEFVAVLGPSGSGKTTLLNIIGGLDRYDSGSMVINGISTDKYTDRDWDSYRNHSIGFVFQSYNLIAHQSILSNVELSLTIAGVSRSERKARAKKALSDVGLADHMHKRPNQLSGGQMQRVAIARALVNNPDILLADEPTGALDSETGLQVMELLKEVAKDHLVVMVTHNEELARAYATRIINLKDGQIVGDSDPYEPKSQALSEPRHENMGRARMSFMTALSLSFNNLRTKKGRTILTAFAGSIGIIGIALILSLSNGVNNYITDLQKSTMVSYPITLQAQSFDLAAIIEMQDEDRTESDHALDQVYSNNRLWEMASQMTGSFASNNLSAFKTYLDDPASEIHKYLGENGIVYDYDTRFRLFAYDPNDTLVPVEDTASSSMDPTNMMSMTYTPPISSQLLPGKDGALISTAITDNYELVYGSWPQRYDQVLVVLSRNNELPYSTLGNLGLVPYDEFQYLTNRVYAGEQVIPPEYTLRYEEVCAQTFYLLPACDLYVKTDRGTYSAIVDDPALLGRRVRADAIPLSVCGIIRPIEDSDYRGINTPIAYTQALTREIIARTEKSDIVTAQKASPDVNVLTGLVFTVGTDEEKIAQARALLENLSAEEKDALARQIMQSIPSQYTAQLDTFMQSSGEKYSTLIDLLPLLDRERADTLLLMIYDRTLSAGSFEENMTAFGAVSLDAPSTISLYADTFENKDAISACIDAYNAGVGEEDSVKYTDYVGLLMSSVTTIVNVISYVLIAFVAVSLVVSSIMIGVITFISVLERTKEIGILRALGASKHNVSQVFNAETFIIGLLAGVIGIGVSLLLLIPINAIIHSLAEDVNISASIPLIGAIALIIISTLLTLISGLIPSRKAAKRDPVTALRTE
ncbi:MAG: ABC transporter ATP-binding protein/permease [Clostridia bacterium]|nr:ABC transporter ATP-binding protein/permease [Clostridia bacterium]